MPDWFPGRLLPPDRPVAHNQPRSAPRPYEQPQPIADFLFCRTSLRDPGGVMQSSTLLAPRELLVAVPFQSGLPCIRTGTGSSASLRTKASASPWSASRCASGASRTRAPRVGRGRRLELLVVLDPADPRRHLAPRLLLVHRHSVRLARARESRRRAGPVRTSAGLLLRGGPRVSLLAQFFDFRAGARFSAPLDAQGLLENARRRAWTSPGFRARRRPSRPAQVLTVMRSRL